MKTSSRRFDEALARGQVYRFLSAAFTYPTEVGYAALQTEFSQEAAGALAVLGWPVDGFEELHTVLRDRPREQFESEHVAIFGHTAAGEVPPYEARYGAGHLFQETHCMADVAGFYRAFGLEASDTCPERPDHIAVELEFMHVLAVKEAYALDREWMEQAEVCREAQAQFLRDHLGRWAPAFLRRLADDGKSGIFNVLAGVTTACLEADCRALGVRIESVALELAPIDFEPAGSDFPCGAEGCGGDPTLIRIAPRAMTQATSAKEGME